MPQPKHWLETVDEFLVWAENDPEVQGTDLLAGFYSAVKAYREAGCPFGETVGDMVRWFEHELARSDISTTYDE